MRAKKHLTIIVKVIICYANQLLVKNNTNYIFELDSEVGAKANHWHTDVTFVPEVPKNSILRGVTIPGVGGQ